MTPPADKITARELHAALVSLRRSEITPDEFRAIMRQSKAQNGEAHHRALLCDATARLSIATGG